MADRPAGTGFWRAMLEARPTREGVFVILLTHATLLTAFTTHRPTLFAAAALLLALYLVGHAGAALAAVSVEASWECPDRVHAAEVFPLRILLRNRGSIPVAGMEIREPGARRDAHPALVGGLLRPGE
ncbi:MAG: hypothetical protein HUU21_32620, partial [Polyangiaceae bacterium]|nr:hypothetical protein [Polyangiaceae bacterium]